MFIPRVQARVGHGDDGKWYFEVHVTELGAGKSTTPVGTFGPWETEEIAHQKMKEAVRFVCEKFERLLDGRASGEFIDMKTNERRKWDSL